MANIISLIVLTLAVGILLWTSSKMASIKRNVLYTSTIVQEQRSQLIELAKKQSNIIHNFNLLAKKLELIAGEEQTSLMTSIDENDINLLNPKITENTRLL